MSMLPWLLQVNGTVLLGLGLGGLALAVIYWAVKVKRAPSTDFLCTLIGMFIGFQFTPPDHNHRPAFDIKDLSCIIAGAVGGGLVGMLIAWGDRRLNMQSQRPTREKKAAPELSDEV